MQKITKKLIAWVLIVALLAGGCLAICACNPQKDNNERTQACVQVGNAFLGGMNDGWAMDATDDQLCALDNPGSLIVTEGWVRLACQAFEKSTLQTRKIQLLAEFLQSAEGRLLIADLEHNAKLIFDMFKDVGFTSADIASLVYCTADVLVMSADDMLVQVMDKLSQIRTLNKLSLQAREDVNLQLANTNGAVNIYKFTSAQKQELSQALKAAQNGILQIVAFAYNMSINTLSDNILNLIFSQDGALTSITDAEVLTIVRALVSNVTDLKNSLGDEDIANLNNALKLFVQTFDTPVYGSTIFAQLTSYAKTAYMVVDTIPLICDVARAFGEGVDSAFVATLREFVTGVDGMSDDIKNINVAVMLAKLASKTYQQLGEEGLQNVVSTLGDIAKEGEYQKATALFALDLMANAGFVLKQMDSDIENLEFCHPQYMDKEKMVLMSNVTLLLGSYFEQFKQKFMDYKQGNATIDEVQKIALNFSEYIPNLYSPTHQPDAWYNEYVFQITQYLNGVSKELVQDATEDLKLFVQEYFVEGSEVKSAMEQLANKPLLDGNAANEQAEEYGKLIDGSNVMMYLVVYLFANGVV